VPTYEYRCKDCGEHLEVVQSFTDDALTTCPACQGTLRKVFGSIGITFKGSGFYKTDSRGSSSRSASSSSDSGSSSGSGDSSSSSATLQLQLERQLEHREDRLARRAPGALEGRHRRR
jgi:putative FmdB family regulatory protein